MACRCRRFEQCRRTQPHPAPESGSKPPQRPPTIEEALAGLLWPLSVAPSLGPPQLLRVHRPPCRLPATREFVGLAPQPHGAAPLRRRGACDEAGRAKGRAGWQQRCVARSGAGRPGAPRRLQGHPACPPTLRCILWGGYAAIGGVSGAVAGRHGVVAEACWRGGGGGEQLVSPGRMRAMLMTPPAEQGLPDCKQNSARPPARQLSPHYIGGARVAERSPARRRGTRSAPAPTSHPHNGFGPSATGLPPCSLLPNQAARLEGRSRDS